MIYALHSVEFVSWFWFFWFGCWVEFSLRLYHSLHISSTLLYYVVLDGCIFPWLPSSIIGTFGIAKAAMIASGGSLIVISSVYSIVKRKEDRETIA